MVQVLVSQLAWGDVKADQVYLYGSEIEQDADGLHFENLSFASGKHIKKWVSRTNYQTTRQAPTLPMLSPGQTYTLVADLKTVPEASVIIQLDYYDRQGQMLSFETFREQTGQFTYPEQAYTYTITLVGAGCQRLTFQSLKIFKEVSQVAALDLANHVSQAYTAETLPDALSLIRPLIQLKGET